MKQNYKNHAKRNPAWILGVLLPFVLNFVWAFSRVIRTVTTETLLNLALAIAFLILWWFVRRMALTVQDRVVRLEMRLRLRDVLPASMHADIMRLTPGHLVALRFASDQEMADLVRDVLAGRLASQKEIKMKIRNWQADSLRA